MTTTPNNVFNDMEVGEVQEAIRNFLNLEWPYDDTRGTVITDVNVVSQEVTTPSSRGMLRRYLYAKNADVLSLTLEIKGAVAPYAGDSYDFSGTIATVFDECKLVLRNLLEEDYQIAISFLQAN